MALHGKQAKTGKQKANRYSKPSRAKRLGRRWDARVEMMRADLAAKEKARIAAAIEAATHPEAA